MSLFASRPLFVRNGAVAALRFVMLAALVSCGGGSESAGPPKPVLTSLTVTLANSSVPMGSATTAIATGLDQNNAPIAVGTVTWSAGSPGVATISSTGQISTASVGSTVITATVGTIQGSATLTVTPPPVAIVAVTPASGSVTVGQTLQLAAATFDATGKPLEGRTIVWTSSDVTIATVASTGLVTAVAPGSATITASSEGKQVTATITVKPIPVAAVSVTPATANILIGATQQLTAATTSATGANLTGRVVTWTSSDATTATVSATGLVTGIAQGTATITATSEGIAGKATVTVGTPAPVPPSITSVSPATLVPGSALTITGAGFASTIGGNTVRVGSVAATVTNATATQITATVPCMASGAAPVTVTTNGLSSTAANATVAVTTRTLAVGQSVQLLDEASVRCNELSITGGKYLISVFNSSPVPGANGVVTFSGNTSPPPATGGSAAPSRVLQVGPTARRATGRSPVEAQTSEAVRLHLAGLDADRDLYARLRPASAAAARDRIRARQLAVPVPPTVGATVPLKTRGFGGSCASGTTATARVVAVNAHSILIEDNASPTAGQVDAELIALGQIFETSQYSVLANFGDINAYDVPGGLDNPGRVVMFFTPTENVPAPGGGIVLGHVSSCDLYASTIPGAGGSNTTKIFYARVPTVLTGSAGTQDTKAWWRAVMPGTLVHESKHLTSYAERFARNATSLEESWLEEGTAQMAAEIYSRSVYAGTSWKSNTTYANSLYCDARRGTATCPNGQSLMMNHFTWLYSYYQDNESKSFLSPGSVDGTIYGSAWMFARWLVDQYGGATESTLLRALTQEPSLTGVNNVTRQTGQPLTALLADWTMSLIADDYPGFTAAAGAKFSFPSWNTRSIWTGLNTDFGTAAFPLKVNNVSFGSFGLTGTLPGGATGILELSGVQATKQLLNLSALPVGTTIRMSILRVQ